MMVLKENTIPNVKDFYMVIGILQHDLNRECFLMRFRLIKRCGSKGISRILSDYE